MRTVWRYGLAVASVAVALFITKSLEQYTDITPLFYAAIVISAWFGGMGPGLLAVALSTVAIDYFFVEPLYTFDLGAKRITFLLVFGFLAVVTSWMSDKRATSSTRAFRSERRNCDKQTRFCVNAPVSWISLTTPSSCAT
jgi:K+-sensing histidine kinase KdpD